jgi:uncharacterized repeat protein (TIGR03803 family)
MKTFDKRRREAGAMSGANERWRLFASVLSSIMLMTASPAHAQTYGVVYSFKGGTDGAYPSGNLIQDSVGNLYGTTENGGAADRGTVFKLAPTGLETVLYQFTGGTDGGTPLSGVIRDSAGNLYGTALFGGDVSCSVEGLGCGAVFKIDPAGHETVLYAFAGGQDGADPAGGLVMDSDGNLYGTTEYGGLNPCFVSCGTVFEIDPAGTETILYNFNGANGEYPLGAPADDALGNLYGTAADGGGFGNGVIWKLAGSGEERVLHSFAWGQGVEPAAGLAWDSAGDLFGTTYIGGDGGGSVFELTSEGKFTVLHVFNGKGGRGHDGARPAAGVSVGPSGNLYGTTGYGGYHGVGTVYRVDTAGQEDVLYDFAGQTDGANPSSGLVISPEGRLYGTARFGGAYEYGVIFKITLR